MIGKIVEIAYSPHTVYHVKVQEVDEGGIRGPYSLRQRGYSCVMGRGKFDMQTGVTIKILEKTELTELE